MNQIPNIEEWEKEFIKLVTGTTPDKAAVPPQWIDFIHQQLQKARHEALQEAVDLSDKIELQEPDGGTKQWMAFKAFRNTLRDRIKELDQGLDAFERQSL